MNPSHGNNWCWTQTSFSNPSLGLKAIYFKWCQPTSLHCNFTATIFTIFHTFSGWNTKIFLKCSILYFSCLSTQNNKKSVYRLICRGWHSFEQANIECMIISLTLTHTTFLTTVKGQTLAFLSVLCLNIEKKLRSKVLMLTISSKRNVSRISML